MTADETVRRLLWIHRDEDGFCATCMFDAPPWFGERYCYPCQTLQLLRELDPDHFASGLRLVASTSSPAISGLGGTNE